MEGPSLTLDAYCIVTMDEYTGGENFQFFDMSPYYQYDLFIQLMNKLKSVQETGFGFWGNRSLILKQVKHLTIIVEKATKDIAAFYIMIPSDDERHTLVEFFEVFHRGKGLGRALIEHESDCRPPLVVEDALHSSRGFWAKVGVPCRRIM